jgi:hypothetical protein
MPASLMMGLCNLGDMPRRGCTVEKTIAARRDPREEGGGAQRIERSRRRRAGRGWSAERRPRLRSTLSVRTKFDAVTNHPLPFSVGFVTLCAASVIYRCVRLL